MEERQSELRVLHPQWNKALIAASIAISFLGAFTSTQLMCHARMSARMSSVFAWSLTGSIIFGFCSIWSLHEVAMLACEFDLLIGIDVGLTVLSALFAVAFTFVALATDMLWDRWTAKRLAATEKRQRRRSRRRHKEQFSSSIDTAEAGSTPLLQGDDDEESDHEEERLEAAAAARRGSTTSVNDFAVEDVSREEFESTGPTIVGPSSVSSGSVISKLTDTHVRTLPTYNDEDHHDLEDQFTASINEYPSYTATNSDYSWSRRGSGTTSGTGSFSLNALGLLPVGSSHVTKNPFAAVTVALYQGCTQKNLIRGFFWSLAIDSMHYVGILGLKVPHGYAVFNPWLVLLSAIISWVVCTVGSILMARMEIHLPQQILFSVIAAAGVAAMHFTGMAATTFYSREEPSERYGYPPALANAVVAIAFITCVTANVLLAHSATVSRNKLAEIVWTRKELWRAIAQRENAEAATRARSDFIASASHELRTPLHHLQGYSDLLAQEELTSEGRKLLNSIQRALKTLSHITNNVLDWSKYERNTEGSHQPVALDIRQACESVIVLLPNVDEEAEVELYVVIAPDVPTTVFLDEDWIHRILMNLLSNALKFTKTGFILLLIEKKGDKLQATVRDTGCGLDPVFMPQMWEPFKQGEVRGSARGTGLGLSIIKQLLSRMNGSVTCESQYVHDPNVGPGHSGTTFTVTVPLQSTGQTPTPAVDAGSKPIAILAKPNSRSAEGLAIAWETSGYPTETINSVAELDPEKSYRYVWTDIHYLMENQTTLKKLIKRKDLLVLVPYDTSDSLEGLDGIVSATNIVLLQKPLIWHTLEKKIAAGAQRRQNESVPSRALRFASDIQVLNDGDAPPNQPVSKPAQDKALLPPSTGIPASAPPKPEKPKKTIMLVEDNPVNQKLGQKMLGALGYIVVLANDGQECIDLFNIPASATTPVIDGVLMDQSMPRKDGVTATAEIRALEAEGKLKGRIASGKRVAIVALTAVVNAEAKEQFREAGADDFLPKPLTLKKLRETLETHLPDDRDR